MPRKHLENNTNGKKSRIKRRSHEPTRIEAFRSAIPNSGGKARIIIS